jgi:excisionase family DNA binding protein
VTSQLTTQQVAAELGVTKARVVALIRAGRLPAEKVGVQYLIQPADLERVRVRKPGRPPAPKAAKAKGRKRKRGSD